MSTRVDGSGGGCYGSVKVTEREKVSVGTGEGGGAVLDLSKRIKEVRTFRTGSPAEVSSERENSPYRDQKVS